MRCSLLVILTVLATLAYGREALAETGIAFDEIKWHAIGAAPLPVGSFEKDRGALMTRVRPMAHFPKPIGDLDSNLGTCRDSSAPTFCDFYRFSYLGKWQRIDDPVAMTATIVRPDLSELIYLNVSKKTYRVAPLKQPAPPAAPTALPSGRPTAFNYRIDSRTESLGSLTIGGTPATGSVSVLTLTTIQPTKDCMPMYMALRWTEYVSNEFDWPDVPSLSPGIETNRDKCSTDSPRSDNSPSAKLMMYLSIETKASVFGVSVPTIVWVTERGNASRLIDSDKALFSIPPDFAKE